MDPIDREVLVLRHFEQLSNGECAGARAGRVRGDEALPPGAETAQGILSALPGRGRSPSHERRLDGGADDDPMASVVELFLADSGVVNGRP